MVLRPFKLKLSPLLFGAILAAASSVEAQRAATNAWQSIIFSSPSNSTNLSNPRSVTTQSAPPSNLGNLFQDTSPVPAFNDLGPAPVPSVGMRLKKSSDRNGNWVFMTPAEIMGVAPDQILQTQNGSAGADDQQGSLTPMERYLAGRNPSAANNAYLATDSWQEAFWEREITKPMVFSLIRSVAVPKTHSHQPSASP